MTDEPHLSATRLAYDTVAVSYAEQVPAVEEDPMDHALLGAFANLVLAAGGGPVVEVGCGTGRVTGCLDRAGLDVSGIDLSPEMLAVARRDHPGLRFSEGSLLDLDLPDANSAGVVAWYSVIHLPPARLPWAFAEFYRVLAPGGYLQLAFHVGDQNHHRTNAYGHDDISLDVYWLPTERICSLLVETGFVVDTQVVREPASRVPQARVLARKPAVS